MATTNVTLVVKEAWWLRIVAYTAYIFMILFRCNESAKDKVIHSILAKGFKYKVGSGKWKKAHAA